MRFAVHDVDQRSEEWRQLRAGLLTGSCAKDILAVRKKGTGELQCRIDLRRRLVSERLTGIPQDDLPYLPKDMKHGVDMEPLAFAAYEARTGRVVRRTGFLMHATMAAGCSPDGYVSEYAGLIELKCPKSTTHLGYLQDGIVPEEYFPQVLHTLWLTGAEWVDFCSFDPRFKAAHLQLFIRRVARADLEQEIAAYELAAELFLSEVARAEEAMLDGLSRVA